MAHGSHGADHHFLRTKGLEGRKPGEGRRTGPGASTPSAQREINALRADGFTVDIEPSDNVWRAGLAGIPKDKTPPCDLLGLMDNLEGAESKHMHADRAKASEFKRRYGLKTSSWREQRDELRDQVLGICGLKGTATQRREQMAIILARTDEWWTELHQTEEEEYRVIFNQRGDMNDSYHTMRLTMAGCPLLLAMCSTGAKLRTADERRGYWQVLQSSTHRLLLGMETTTGENLVWCRAPMGNKASSDSFLQQVVWQKMLLECFDPYRSSDAYLNTPEMVDGEAPRTFQPDLPIGRVATGSDGGLAATTTTFADDWAHAYHEWLETHPSTRKTGRALHQAHVGGGVTAELGLTNGRHLHRVKGQFGDMVMFTGFEVISRGGGGGRPHMRVPHMKQFNGQIRLHHLGFKSGLHLAGMMNRHMHPDMSAQAALRMTREGSDLSKELRGHSSTRVTRRELAGVTGYFNHLSAVVKMLASCMRSLTKCIYAGVTAGGDVPSQVVDWDEECEVSERAWLDTIRAMWILQRGYYTKILTKGGAVAMLAIQDASEEYGGGFCAELKQTGPMRPRMRVFAGRHTPRNRLMTSGPKELAFVCHSIREAVRLWRERAADRGPLSDDEERKGFLASLDADLMADIGRLLLFTDSAVSVYASLKGYSNSPEMQLLLDEIELLLMESGLEVTFKHLPGRTMIAVHVDGASRCDAGPLLRVQDPMKIHPYVMHKWGLTPQMRRAAQSLHDDVVFVDGWSQLDFKTLPGTTFALCVPPEALLPLAMRALEMWTARPCCTRVILFVARDFGTPQLRSVLRQFDLVEGGQRFRRLPALTHDCVWETLMAIKSPWAPPPIHSRDVRAEYERLRAENVSVARGSCVGQSRRAPHRTATPDLNRFLKRISRGAISTGEDRTTRGEPSSPQGANKAYSLGLGVTKPQPATTRERIKGRSRSVEPAPRPMSPGTAAVVARIHAMNAAQTTQRQEAYEYMKRLEDVWAAPKQCGDEPVAKWRAPSADGNTLRGRKLTGGKKARKERRQVQCNACGASDQATEMFACRFNAKGPTTNRHGSMTACGSVLCPRCLPEGVPSRAHPSRVGRVPVTLTSHHARMVAGTHICPQCRWRICTGVLLDMEAEEDRYVSELITQYLMDMYRHLTPSTTSGYAREVNVLADFAAALPDLCLDDVVGCIHFNESDVRISTIHAMLWLHLERSSGLKYGTIRKVRSVVSKLAQIYGEESPLNRDGSEFKRFTKAFKMRVGTASRPSPALSVKAWFAILRIHANAHTVAVQRDRRREARDELCKLVHAELSFMGFLRASEQICMQREDVVSMICDPQRAAELGVKPYVCLPLMGPTKTSTNEAAGVVVCWRSASGVRIGEHVSVLLRWYHEDGEPHGALLTHGEKSTPWSKTHALHKVVRPALEAAKECDGCIAPGVKLSWYTLNCFRRGGNTHALDRGVKPWQNVNHGRCGKASGKRERDSRWKIFMMRQGLTGNSRLH
jgi:hypothetical protein